MEISFYKYHGAGNDFIIIDNRTFYYDNMTFEQRKILCDRRYGVGADGLMFIQPCGKSDFRMVYFNSDGNEGSMCGNGGRCIVAFANKIGMIKQSTKFDTIDGFHEATIEGNQVKLLMSDVVYIDNESDYFFLNTGSPHYVKFVEGLSEMDVFTEGRKVRNNKRFKEKGTNVNFAERTNDGLFVRTYERGVEVETLSCGTGVVATAIVSAFDKSAGNYIIPITTKGGELQVSFQKTDTENYQQIWLKGPTEFVFSGKIILK